MEIRFAWAGLDPSQVGAILGLLADRLDELELESAALQVRANALTLRDEVKARLWARELGTFVERDEGSDEVPF